MLDLQQSHGMEHALSAYYDITHGEGLAILTPRWMKHILSDRTVDRFVKYGVNVFGIDKSLDKYEIADKAIELDTGARGLRSIVESAMTKIMFEVPSDKTIKKVTVTRRYIEKGGEPLYKREKSA